jgi:uncharacterized repeat protein (TIGR01451 family)
MTRLALVAAFSAMLAVSQARAGVTASSDLAVTNTDGVTLYTAGDPVTYTIVVTNAGPDDAVGATVTDAVVALPQVASASWTCIGDLGATCALGSIAGDINDTVNVPVGGTLTYKLIVSTRSTAVGNLVAAAHVTPPAGVTDPDTANNTATDIDTAPVYDLTVTNTSFLSFRGGLFHDRYSDTGIPTTTSYNYQTPTTTLNAIIPPALQGGTNPSGVNTPRSLITSFDTTKRATFDVDYNHVLNAGKAGLHTIKGGFGYQHISNDVNSYYPGGYVDIFWDRSFSFGGVTQGTGRGTYGYYAVNDRRIAKPASSDIRGSS